MMISSGMRELSLGALAVFDRKIEASKQDGLQLERSLPKHVHKSDAY